MTVAELIKKLETMPRNAEVIYRECSEWSVLEEQLVTLSLADSTEIVKHKERYMDYEPRYYKETDVIPEFVTVVCFPGN